MIQPLWRTVGRLLKKLRLKLSYDPAVLPVGIHADKNTIQKDRYPYVHCSTSYNSQATEAT